MRSRRFTQVDVFGAEPYGGNPLAVVHDAEELDDAAMQRFARWTNLSETTFLLSPLDPEADYRVRIFTPTQELPFAGHPTLGSAYAWLQAGGSPGREQQIVQECGAGLVRLRETKPGLAFAAPPLRRSGPVEEDLLRRIADMLDLERTAIVDASWLVNGPEWIGLLLENAEAVLAVQPGALQADIGIAGLTAPGSAEALEVRAFVPAGLTTLEDPVTGSLNAAFAQWLLATGRLHAPYVARQGTVLGCSGRVHVTTEADEVWIGGHTTTCVTGSVEL
jgi:PhzF family phenazine biosynthesis protein